MITEASRKLGFPPKLTMTLAGKLFREGLISYHRTDSIEIDPSKLPDIHQKITAFYGEKYLEKRAFKNKKGAKNIQEAHGAITPVDINITSDEIRSDTGDSDHDAQAKLYSMIWKRTIASQMKDALFDRTSIEFSPSKNPSLALFAFSDQELVFEGYLKATKEEVRNNPAPKINEGQSVDFIKLTKEHPFTSPPP